MFRAGIRAIWVIYNKGYDYACATRGGPPKGPSSQDEAYSSMCLRVPDLKDICIEQCETATLDCILECPTDNVTCISQCIRDETQCIEGKNKISTDEK